METAGTPLGQYQLLEKIAQGGMAEIFRGKSKDFQGIEKPVVIKRILPQIAASPEFVEMLIDEAKIAVQLSHGNIAQIYDLGKVADDYFIVMEYVEGKTLSQVMKRLRTLGKKMPIAYALWIATEIATGLDYMHRKTDENGNPLHIVHRDISPQNIIISTSGTLKIIDFGIAKAKTKVSTTDSGVLKGKFAYMSPEHAEGERLDHRSDIFSLGIILHELLTGERLFKGKNNKETIQKVKRVRVVPPSSLRQNIEKELDRIVLKALERDRNRRFATSAEFREELTRYRMIHYPDFSPPELIRYLGELFPDIALKTAEAGPGSLPTETEKGGEPPEETAGAASQMIRQHLEEEEIFELPPSAESPNEQPVSEASRRFQGRHAAILGAIALLIVLGYLGGPTASQFLNSLNQPTAEPETVPNLQGTVPLPVPLETLPQRGKPPVRLVIQSEPPGATLFLEDQKTDFKTPVALDIRSGQKIGLYLANYRFWEKTITTRPGERADMTVPMELNPGGLEIHSIPAGGAVYLNNQKVGETPYTLSQIAPETRFDLVVRLDGYEEWSQKVKIVAGRREVVSASLRKIKKSRTLR